MEDQKQQLTDLTRGLHHAASSTQVMLFHQFVKLLDYFFEKDGDKFKAKMVEVEDDDATYKVPLIALVRPSGLLLKRMEVEMSVHVDEVTVKKIVHKTLENGDEAPTRGSFKVTLAPPSKGIGRSSETTDIKLVFEADEAPEGVMRLIDEYTNRFIEPIKGKQDEHAP